MGNITPTSDVRAWVNGTSFQIGDTVQSTVDSRIGVILNPDGLIPTLIPLPTPHVVPLPSAYSPLPSPTGGSPATPYVQVKWSDGTISTVLLSTLARVR
jgi:hypothetical protein